MLDKKEDYEIKPEIKDLAVEYLQGVEKLSDAQKINKLFIETYNAKPDPRKSISQILSRLLYRNKFKKQIEDTNKFLKNKKKKFKWPSKFTRIFKRSKKKKNQILVWFLNVKGEIEPPQLYPIYSSNMIIIKNRPYQVDPRSFWRMGKYICQIIKGIDRRPVSNLDYAEIQRRGDSTDSDEFLIKAALQAVAGDAGKKKPIDKKIIIIGGLIAAAVAIYFMSTGGV